MNFSERLDFVTKEACKDIEELPQMQAMLSGALSEEKYIGFLMNLYPVVSNFCPVMAFAAGHCADRHNSVRRYLYDHIFEEREHEHLVLNDLCAFGVDVTDVPSRLPSPPVQAMIAYNFYFSGHDPVHVLGMIYVLEIMAFLYGGQVARSVSSAMGRTVAEGFTFLDSHAELDEDHTIKLKDLFNSLHISHDNVLLNSIEINFFLFKNIINFRGKSSSVGECKERNLFVNI